MWVEWNQNNDIQEVTNNKIEEKDVAQVEQQQEEARKFWLEIRAQEQKEDTGVSDEEWLDQQFAALDSIMWGVDEEKNEEI